MIAPWIIYAVLVTSLLFLATALLDRIVRAWGRPTRLIWLGAMIGGFLVTTAAFGLRTSRVYVIPWVQPSEWLSAVAAFAVTEARTVALALFNAGRFVGPSDRLLLRGWGTMIAIVLVLLAASAVRLRRHRSRWGSGTLHGTDVLVTDSLGPAVVGFRSPEIALPVWVLDAPEADQRLVVEHERQHVAARDGLIRLLALFPLALQPWNPALWLMFRRLRAATEIDCDRRVLRRFPYPEAYAELLVSVAARTGRDRPFSPSLVESRGDLERRVRAILSPVRRPGIVSSVARAAACALLVTGAWGTPVPPVSLMSLGLARMPRRAPDPRQPVAATASRAQSLPVSRCSPPRGLNEETTEATAISPGVRVQSHLGRDGSGYLVFVRGNRAWRGSDPQRSMRTVEGGVRGFAPSPGDWRNTLTYDPATNILAILGVRVPLDSGNVVLVDRIDGAGGEALVQIAGCVDLRPSALPLDRAMRIPDVRAFRSRGASETDTLSSAARRAARLEFTVEPLPAIRSAVGNPTACPVPPPTHRSVGTGGQPILPGVRVARIWDRGRGGFLAFIRGSPGWDYLRGAPRSRVSGTGTGIDTQIGSVRYTLRSDSATNSLDVNGVIVPLDSGNVVLIARVDGVGGPPIVSIAGCIPMGRGRATIWRAIATLPEVRAFLNRKQ